jgi:hypothetical protein
MAEEKKEEKKPGKETNVLHLIVGILFGMYVLYRLLMYGVGFFANNSPVAGSNEDGSVNSGLSTVGVDIDGDGIIDEYVYSRETETIEGYNPVRRFIADPTWKNFSRILTTSPFFRSVTSAYYVIGTILYIITLVLVFFIIKFKRATSRLENKAKAERNVKPVTPAEAAAAAPKSRWEVLKERMAGDNPEGWKVAILEADIILDEILDMSGYRGESIGEKLKKVEASDMPSLNDAWEAHKVRNAIAHQGDAFILTHREALRVMRLYERVFKDFNYI